MKQTMKFAGFDIHPAANLFPMMTEEEFEELKDDVQKHGQILPIILHEGKILDGRNRAMVCHQLGITPKVETWDGDGSPTDYAIGLNAKRRNLTKTQLSCVATDALPLYEAEAAERARVAPHQEDAKEKIPDHSKGQARDKAAAAVGVNPRYVSDAKKIKEESPETFEAMKSGEVTMSEAKKNLYSGNKKNEGGKVEKPAENHPDDSDPESLWSLKYHWKRATKKEKTAFLEWVNAEKH